MKKFLFLILFGLVLGICPSTSGWAVDANNTVYLPLIKKPDSFSSVGMPIWLDEAETLSHEVGLFRSVFTLPEATTSVELKIFADTRYEVFLDGLQIGRGPARFSLSRREYDVYSLGSLASGEHVLAVLVQWAPNNRRSESIAPLLQAHLNGKVNDNFVQLLVTDESWKAIRSSAWNSDAALVHSWELLGPTELVDLRQHPSDWYAIGFDDSTWPNAVQTNLTAKYQPLLVPHLDLVSPMADAFSFDRQAELYRSDIFTQYSARSIELLDNYPISTTLVERGMLSPGRELIELPGDQPSYSLKFNVSAPILFSMEVLSSTNIPQPGSIMLNGAGMLFDAEQPARPDVMVAKRVLGSGPHTLTIDHIPSTGFTFSISSENISFQADLPFQQGNHAGRRLLLAEPVSNTVPINDVISSSLDLHFDMLPAYAVIDLGRTIHGRAELQITGPAGTIIDLGWDERLYPGTKRPLPFPGSFHPQWNQVDSWVLDGHPRKITTLDTRTGRYLLLAVWGQSGPVDLSLSVTEERYPVSQQGYFDSSNQLLDQIWQVGVETIYPNMTDAYADPWRERGQWWGDAFVVDRANRVTFGDFALLKRGLLYMAGAFEQGQPEALAPNGEGVNLVDYAMLWVHDLQEYLQLTGDRTFVHELYPTLVEFLDYLESLENPTTGLLDFDKDAGSRMVYIDTMAWMTRQGQSVPANALYIETLRRAAAIAEESGDSQRALAWQTRATQIQAQINTLLYLPEQERYLTSIYQGQPISATLYAQAWPLAYQLVPEDSEAGVVLALQELLSSDPSNPNMGIYGMYWVLEGLGRYGYIEDALALIETYYGWMLSEGATTWWESFIAQDHYDGSLSHGWGSSPTWFLTTYVLGARQVGPGDWQIQPAFSGVEHVAGSLPLPQGGLFVQWEKQSCQNSSLTLSAPSGSRGEIIVELQPQMTISLDGETIWQDGALQDFVWVDGSKVYIQLSSGDYLLEITKVCNE